jgi:hypothetical protein
MLDSSNRTRLADMMSKANLLQNILILQKNT